MSSGITPELLKILARFDVTEVFKTKGNLRRWSAKRTIGGMIATTACYDIATHGISWEAVCCVWHCYHTFKCEPIRAHKGLDNWFIVR